MKKTKCTLADGTEITVYTVDTLIIGSGAASLNCAEHLHSLGVPDIAIVTERLGAGTSANSGSDKQTYYKIGIFGDVPDSPMDFAQALTKGGMMHGDLAYIEGVGSATEFFHLVKNGVPFPYNSYGAYVGYKTDMDPRQRATSAGPKTSMFMVEKSLAQVRRDGTPVFDFHEVISLVAAGPGDQKRVVGALALNKKEMYKDNCGLVAFNANNVVMGTGGPGDMYKVSVYPEGQIGNHGIALEIGAVGNNLTESQFGLASTKFRWNLSGTYQQVVPAYFSTDEGGGDKKYFLNEYFHTMKQVATNTFLKGYQWPFHAEKLDNLGSSVVDIAVNSEILAGRRVFMDFMANPVADGGLEEFSLENLEPEARRYLERSGALQGTPYERLVHMNLPSIELYSEHEVDLREPLEVAVCSQHNNGGLRGNLWWESNIKHLFPVGELNGAHGVRPGGSALNSGQVGGLRAAQFIANVYQEGPLSIDEFVKLATPQIEAEQRQIQKHLSAPSGAPTTAQVREEIQARMSEHAAFIRSLPGVTQALNEAKRLRAKLQEGGMCLAAKSDLVTAIQNDHLCLTHIAFLEALKTLIERGGGSRGSYMIVDEDGDHTLETKKGAVMRYRSENLEMRQEILETRLTESGEFDVQPVPVRPLPQDDSWYETTWNDWMVGKIFG